MRMRFSGISQQYSSLDKGRNAWNTFWSFLLHFNLHFRSLKLKLFDNIFIFIKVICIILRYAKYEENEYYYVYLPF